MWLIWCIEYVKNYAQFCAYNGVTMRISLKYAHFITVKKESMFAGSLIQFIQSHSHHTHSNTYSIQIMNQKWFTFRVQITKSAIDNNNNDGINGQTYIHTARTRIYLNKIIMLYYNEKAWRIKLTTGALNKFLYAPYTQTHLII